MFGWLFGRRNHGSREYLRPGRLEDVIALIQVLGLDEYTSRGENALRATLGDGPASAGGWCEVARRHPEFFRVNAARGGGDAAALIARRLTGKDDQGPVLKPEYIHGLVEAAIDLHNGQLRRKEVLRATWAVIVFAVLPSLGSVATALITRAR